MSAAIAIVAIGDIFRRAHERIFRPSVARYAARHGYDLLMVRDHLGAAEFHGRDCISFTKLMVPFQDSVQRYDRLLVLDADILVHAQAPPFHLLDLGDGIGVVDEWSQPTPAARLALQHGGRRETSPRDYYGLAGFPIETGLVINSGMFVCAPARHADFFRGVVARRLPGQPGHPRGFHFEQAAFGYELQMACLARLLPAAWNRVWPLHRPSPIAGVGAADGAASRAVAFRHFAGVHDDSVMLHMAAGIDHDFAYLRRHR